MKFSAQEEYGLRCLLAIGRHPGDSVTIGEIARLEGLTEPYVAKLLAVLRREGLIASTRGSAGGYSLAREPAKIAVAEALDALGGRLYDPGFCDRHTGLEEECLHVGGCSLKPLWSRVQGAVDRVLSNISLADLMAGQLGPESTIQVLSERPGSAGGRG